MQILRIYISFVNIYFPTLNTTYLFMIINNIFYFNFTENIIIESTIYYSTNKYGINKILNNIYSVIYRICIVKFKYYL